MFCLELWFTRQRQRLPLFRERRTCSCTSAGGRACVEMWLSSLELKVGCIALEVCKSEVVFSAIQRNFLSVSCGLFQTNKTWSQLLSHPPTRPRPMTSLLCLTLVASASRPPPRPRLRAGVSRKPISGISPGSTDLRRQGAAVARGPR